MTETNWQELAYTLFEEAGDALFLFDPETEQLHDVNPMAQRLSGYSRRELLKMKVTQLFRSEVAGGLQRLRQAFRRTGLFHSQEGFFLRHQDNGLWIPVNLTITRLHADPKVLGLITARDIREQREAHTQLKKIEAELRRVTSSVSDCLWSAEVDDAGKWKYCYFSPVVERITGRQSSFYQPGLERWLSTVHPEDRGEVERAFDRLRAGASGSAEYRLLWPDGTVRWVHDSVMVTQGGSGHHLLLDGVISDVTERKRADDALRESESRQRLLMEQMPAILWTTDNELRFTSGVGAGMGALGLTPNQLNGVKVSAYLESEDPEFLPMAAHLSALKGESASHEINWKGRAFQVHMEPLRRRDGSISGCIGVALDITERKHAESALQESQRALLTLLSNLPGMAYRCRDDADWTMEFVSEGALELTGYSTEQLIAGHTVSYAELIHPDDRAGVWDEVRKAVAEGRPFRVSYRIRTASGDEKWVWEQGRLVHRSEEGVPILEGFITDITERRRAHEALHASEAKYRSLIENLTQSVFLKDRDLRFVAVNRLLCENIGRAEENIIGKNDYDFYPPEMAERFRADDRIVLTEGKRLEREEQTIIAGKVRTVQTVKSPVRDEEGRVVGVLGIFWDVTEQRTLEAQLRQAQKMDAVGQMAGGIAHDFNNLLTAVLGNLELAQMELPEAHACRELLASAIKAGFRAAELTRQLLSFARQTPLRPGMLNINACIDETVRLLRRTIDPRITVQTDTSADAWSVQADASQMGQVLMNLCLNARDAMPQGGTLRLETSNVTLDAPAAMEHPSGRLGEFVRLSVCDTGEGMPPDIMDHVFEPFFTTKGPGKGTGLGLAVVFGIVKQHGGWIECQSKVGKGTRFDIYLPRSSAIGEATADVNDVSARGGTETVLLADDQDMVRSVGRGILERHGYRVLTAADGQEAVDIFKQRKAEIDLVILDYTMPKLSGLDAFRLVRQLNPVICVLFSSGNYSEQALQELEREQSVAFVVKPYRPVDLARSVRDLLDKHRTRAAVGSDWAI
jgi:PAS domain S-box-containing protein